MRNAHVALLLICAGCAADTSQRCTAEDALGVSPLALYSGSTEPQLGELTAAQRRAFVTIEPAYGYSRGLCSGVVIAPGWVLSAKHCDEPMPLVIISGDQTIAAQAEHHVVHPKLDLMLLEATALAEHDELEPIGLRRQPLDRCMIGADVELAGFGETETGSVGTLHFLRTQVAELSDASIIVDGHGHKGACVGDSGGPLLLRNHAGSTEVAGILSGGSASCVDRDQYTRLDNALDWIASVISTPAA